MAQTSPIQLAQDVLFDGFWTQARQHHRLGEAGADFFVDRTDRVKELRHDLKWLSRATDAVMVYWREKNARKTRACGTVSAQPQQRAAASTQLRKLLADWCNGAENSFPVQLVLLTRAQWRVAATIPRSVDEARKLLRREFTEQRRQATELVKDFELTTTAKLVALEDLIKTHATNTARTVSEICGHLSDADKTAKQIRGELERGAEK